jgi:hypothetical protein
MYDTIINAPSERFDCVCVSYSFMREAPEVVGLGPCYNCSKKRRIGQQALIALLATFSPFLACDAFVFGSGDALCDKQAYRHRGLGAGTYAACVP